jgi:hypothetical protein
MALVINFLDENLIDKVLHFFNSEKGDIMRHNNRRKIEFEWLFLDGYSEKALYTVVTDPDTDEIIATHAGIFIPMASQAGEKIITLKGEDTLISFDKMIKLGKRDILVEMERFLEQGAVKKNVSFIWGFSPVRTAFRRCGFEISDQVKGSFLVMKPFRFYSLRIKIVSPVTLKRRITLLSFAVENYLIQRSRGIFSKNITYADVPFADINFKKIREFVPKDVCSLWLDEKFLEWRIQRNPSGVKYGFLEFRNSGADIIAYLIYSENNDRTIYFEQFLFNNNLSKDEKSDVVNGAKNFFRKKKAVMLRAMGFSHNKINAEEMNLLRRAGFNFFANREPSYFIFKELSGSGIGMQDIYVSRLNTQGVV